MENVALELNIPQDILFTLNVNVSELSQEIKKILAIELYKTTKLSLGQSVKLANICKVDFIKLLGEKGVSIFNWDDEEIQRELETVKSFQ
jgi:predicted HTH domain antitoxin